MLSKTQIKQYKALKNKKNRQESGLFVVEGEKMVAEALASGFSVVEVIEDAAAIEQISSLTTPPSKIAVVRMASTSKADALKPGLYLALDSLRDPGNLGTILRLADWFGIRRVFMSDDTVEIYNPKVVQSTMGSIFRVSYEYCNLADVCKAFVAAGGEVLGTFLGGENLYEIESRAREVPTLVVIGSESFGISSEIEALCTRRITIPSFSQDGAAEFGDALHRDPSGVGRGCESLNAAIAAAVTISQLRG